MLGAVMGGIKVEKVLVECRQEVKREYFASIFVDDTHKGPVLLCSAAGGTGIEELAREHPEQVAIFPIDPREGLYEFQARNVLIKIGVPSAELAGLAEVLVKLYKVARKVEARSAEINPVAMLADGKFLALDARVAVDDNAVFRHPELGIEVAREFSHAPTLLERTAYMVESKDYRGTFYFAEMKVDSTGRGHLGGLPRHGRRRRHDGHGRRLPRRPERRQLLRYQRQPAGLQGVPRRAHHPVAARPAGLLPGRLRRGQPGAVPHRAGAGQGLQGGPDCPSRRCCALAATARTWPSRS